MIIDGAKQVMFASKRQNLIVGGTKQAEFASKGWQAYNRIDYSSAAYFFQSLVGTNGPASALVSTLGDIDIVHS